MILDVTDFSPCQRKRADETAKRIREGVSPVPMFTETRKGVGDRVISNIGWAMPQAAPAVAASPSNPSVSPLRASIRIAGEK